MNGPASHSHFQYTHLFQMGHALLAKQLSVEAMARFKAALALRPDSAEAHYGLALALDDSGRPQEAAASFEQAGQLAPEFAQAEVKDFAPAFLAPAYLRQAIRQSNCGQSAAAEKAIGRACAIDPATPSIYVHLGYVFAAQGRLTDAVAAFRQAVLHESDLNEAYRGLGNMLTQTLEFSEATASLNQAIDQAPEDGSGYMLRAVLMVAQGKLELAEQDTRRAIDLDPTAMAYSLLGLLVQRQTKMDEAEALHRTALAMDEDFGLLHCHFSFWLQEAGRNEEAATVMAHGIDLASSESWAHACHSEFLSRQGRHAEAQAALDRGRAQEPWTFPLQGKLRQALFRHP